MTTLESKQLVSSTSLTAWVMGQPPYLVISDASDQDVLRCFSRLVTAAAAIGATVSTHGTEHRTLPTAFCPPYTPQRKAYQGLVRLVLKNK